MARVVRSDASVADLTEIWTYIAKDNVKAADKLLRQIDDAMQLIGLNPEIGFAVEDVQPEIRCKPVRRLLLVFDRVVGDVVEIVRVLHGRRNLGDMLS